MLCDDTGTVGAYTECINNDRCAKGADMFIQFLTSLLTRTLRSESESLEGTTSVAYRNVNGYDASGYDDTGYFYNQYFADFGDYYSFLEW